MTLWSNWLVQRIGKSEVLEVADEALGAVDIVEPRDLDEPDDWWSFKRGTRGERVG